MTDQSSFLYLELFPELSRSRETVKGRRQNDAPHLLEPNTVSGLMEQGFYVF